MKKPIHDIFSKTAKAPKVEINKIPIVIDSREKQSLVASFLVQNKANIKFETLEIGDYLVGDTAIERKSFKDFQASIIDKRLVNQLIELKKYPKSFLILEGFCYQYQDSIVHENAIRGMLLSSILDFKIPIAYTESEEDTAKLLLVLARRYEKQKVDISLRPKKSSLTFQEQKQFILEGFPGIGPTTAKKMLNKFKTIKNTILASEKELKEIDSLDENKTREFRKLVEE